MPKSRLFLALLMLVCLVFFAVPSLSSVQTSSAQMNAAGAYTVRYTAEFRKEELSFDQFKGYDIVRLRGDDYLSDVGKPMLPWKELTIALPSGMAVKSVQAVDSKSEAISGEYYIFPAQPPMKIGLSEKDVDFVEPDQQTYTSNQPYPSKLVEFTYQTDLAGQGMAVIRLYPVQYVPAEKRLTLYTSINVVIEGVGGYECGDYLPPNISETDTKALEQRVKEMVVNPEEVQLVTAFKPFTSMVPPGGPFAHVIITSSSFASYFQPLADWHTQKGVKDTVITTAWIYATTLAHRIPRRFAPSS
jgi:hypothetical protein